MIFLIKDNRRELTLKHKIAMIQLDIHYGDTQTNYTRASTFIDKAVKSGADIILLPELWTSGYDLTRLDEIADDQAKESIAFLQEQAKKYNVSLVGGSVAEKCDDGVRNTLLVVDSKGKLVHKYSKLHLFQLMDEHVYLEEGNDKTEFELDGTDSAGFICYDIRFPEWMRKSALNDAKVMYVVAEWPKLRIDHWRILLQARAIENQCYVIACNRSGSDPKNEFGGMSLIIDPWGEVVAEGGLEEEIVIGEVDFSLVEEVRKRIPVFGDRREERY
ncbi:carbon-nitrogen family hydrolase [Virgibacillus necropolis]|uniref:Carbon-nitrogen hydrolase n=1 Tax=Virgibacillus necropolis TaxID=163877 RepID=A0A221MAN6_9BACI|nr:carbon-nitrogen family hydrolase [Virgibacillus necropolis]ASN04703.1 carbon-nitrogen hydrolase [Virgibacillus necropolis]